MYNHFCRCYRNYMKSVPHGTYRYRIAECFEGFMDLSLYQSWHQAGDGRFAEVSDLLYRIGKEEHPRMKTLIYELSGVGYDPGKEGAFTEKTAEQMKLITLLLSTHYM